ncbi:MULTISPECIES: DUF2231 domain-containing protein [Gordonia]|uniref:DUF2231 domain-containing protein n=2 Tax=Gordonia alkanivorans TaxID=84096 RepID=F9VYL0_9ACTN|nr:MULTISPECIES: DUF2231 domain-containing protein [Gordonia]ETA07576.1 membrane protein [Gordonia alkanivorans CGMCC 6845]MDH3008292.1 hypothetical protein [Gordonia alkanivorans]MDH3012339.1 hypothetical protein [Gordonia alkanivorans]MDH3017318.1 hypothetical protein [Gordonia alkanivorans]MDH3022587.1 hypothetical protein [Gordonia alkanivorans]
MNTINGLPLHPLLVHIVVVLVPLSALMAIAAVCWPAARARLGILTPLVALVALIALPLTTSAGESLEEQVGPSAAIERHAGFGEQVIYWVGPLFALAVVWWALHNERVTTAVHARIPASSKLSQRAVAVALGVALVVVALGSLYIVFRTGESGARSVWS